MSRYISCLKGVEDNEMNLLISKHLLMRCGIQPSEIDKLSMEDVMLFKHFDKEMREYETKSLAYEISKIIAKAFGG